MTSGIYKLSWYEDGEEIVYIGQSVNINRRIQEHTRAMESGTHSNNLVQLVFDTLGLPNIEVLARIPRNELNAAEAYYVNLYGSNTSLYGLNKTAGGGSRDGGPIYAWSPSVPKGNSKMDNGLEEALRKRGVVPLYETLIFNRWTFAVVVVFILVVTGVYR